MKKIRKQDSQYYITTLALGLHPKLNQLKSTSIPFVLLTTYFN